MHVEIAQMDIELGEKEVNLDKALKIIRGSKADLILFPELFTTGFDFNRIVQLAEPLDGKTMKEITDACGNKMVAGSLIEVDDKWIYNTFILVDETGVIGKYRKIHLFNKEKNFFSAGGEPSITQTRFGNIALATCYDIRFPELFRGFMENEADFVLVCANFPKTREKHWDVLVKARAIENQFYVLACNRVGKDLLNKYNGRSMAVDPGGDLLAVGDDREEVLKCMVDRRRVKETRNQFPVLEDIKIK
ncbi:MAG: carbon-nitrogen family hydrolase [Candidatus Altiarchaeota archaeon]|nr:carbon-nitrogen family hydrolase [Candidatus Altiarchaeota archaeon]